MEEIIALFESLTGVKDPKCVKIAGEGSNRSYYRLSAGETSYIGVQGESLEENNAFIAISDHFSKRGLPVPRVLCVSEDRMRYIQEDLGDTSLFSAISNGVRSGSFSAEEEALLMRAIACLPDLQFKGGDGMDYSCCYPQPEFDKRCVMWDLNYFKYMFLKPLGMDFSEPRLEDDFEHLCDDLLQEQSETFLYRDFQSRNVMVKDGMPYFIDFQGGRKGPIYYDVASFVWQARANFPDALKWKLVDAYLASAKKYRAIDSESFKEKLRLFVLFRNLQVLGAYGFRGLYEKKRRFIECIPSAVANLKTLLGTGFSNYPYLSELLLKMVDLPSLQKEQKPIEKPALKVLVYSFSYKKGIPEDPSGNGGGYVFDCRGVHNPGRYEQYKSSTGMDANVIQFLEENGEILKFLESVYALADAHVARYIKRGFTHLMFSFGCTGGQHRSVYSAQHVAEHIAEKFGVEVELIHREQKVRRVFNG